MEDHVEKSTLAVRCLRRLCRFDPATAADIGADDFVFDAPGVEAIAAACAGVVLEAGDEVRAATLLVSGAPCVFLGQAALRDSAAVERLVAAQGGAAIGVYAPARRQAVSWSFETLSNADFKTVTPSVCEPAWEVLKADGSATGTQVSWWLGALRDLGATHFLVRADIRDDTDLNICAGLVETLGDSLWLGPLTDENPRLDEWAEFGRCRQFALPTPLYERQSSACPDSSPCPSC
jgi:hypothetical protein